MMRHPATVLLLASSGRCRACENVQLRRSARGRRAAVWQTPPMSGGALTMEATSAVESLQSTSVRHRADVQGLRGLAVLLVVAYTPRC